MVGPQQIGPQTHWWLICHLHTCDINKNKNNNNMAILVLRVGGSCENYEKYTAFDTYHSVEWILGIFPWDNLSATI